MTKDRARLLVATTIPETAWTLMAGQLAYLRKNGFDVVLVSSPGPRLEQTARREGIDVRGIPIQREITPGADLIALWRLVKLMRAERVDVSLVGTPKAGLLAGLAAALTRVPLRIYLLRGLRLETERGWRRLVLWLGEWLAIHSAHNVVAVSPSLLMRARTLRLLGSSRGIVLGHGASNGVDLRLFGPSSENARRGASLRADHGIPSDAFVFGFVGRLAVDKGVAELAAAMAELESERSDTWLLVVGAEELGGLPEAIRVALSRLPRVRFTGWIDQPELAYHAMNCLVLPTYREGFPNAPLEAAAAGKPVITTTATGAIDSVIDRATGLLVPPRSVAALTGAMRRVASDPCLVRSMGQAGRRFVERYYRNEDVWGALLAFLRSAAVPTQRRSHLPGTTPRVSSTAEARSRRL